MSAAAGLIPAQRRWWLALTASLLVHLTLLSTPGWRLATLDDLLTPPVETPLEAHLTTPPVPRAAPAAAPPAVAPARPRAARNARPPLAPPVPEPVPDIPSGSGSLGLVAASEGLAASSPASAPVPAAAIENPLPRRARIRYAIMRGEQGFVVGRAEHRWSLEGTAYTLRAVAETTGLAALFRPATVTQVSEGEVTADGLRPRGFRVEREGKVGDTASFDWAAGRVAMNPGPRDAPLEPGMQDLLSLFWQLGLLPADSGATVLVATGKKIERYAFARVGEEKIDTPLGTHATLHLKTVGMAGGDATEIWLGLDARRLPLRIRHADRKGEVFDQIVDELEIE